MPEYTGAVGSLPAHELQFDDWLISSPQHSIYIHQALNLCACWDESNIIFRDDRLLLLLKLTKLIFYKTSNLYHAFWIKSNLLDAFSFTSLNTSLAVEEGTSYMSS